MTLQETIEFLENYYNTEGQETLEIIALRKKVEESFCFTEEEFKEMVLQNEDYDILKLSVKNRCKEYNDVMRLPKVVFNTYIYAIVPTPVKMAWEKYKTHDKFYEQDEAQELCESKDVFSANNSPIPYLEQMLADLEAVGHAHITRRLVQEAKAYQIFHQEIYTITNFEDSLSPFAIFGVTEEGKTKFRIKIEGLYESAMKIAEQKFGDRTRQLKINE